MQPGTKRRGPGIMEVVSAVAEVLKRMMRMSEINMPYGVALQPVLMFQIGEKPGGER